MPGFPDVTTSDRPTTDSSDSMRIFGEWGTRIEQCDSTVITGADDVSSRSAASGQPDLAQGGRCPSCGEFLLHADHEPRSALEWEQWFMTVRRVLRKQHIVEQVDGQDRTFYRLLHAHCQRRLTTTHGHQP